MDAKQVTFTQGTHNLFPDEIIPKGAASASLNWLTKDGSIELVRGRQSVGGDGAAGKNYGEHTAYTVAGVAVHYRKVDTKVQYLNGSTWTDVITGLTASDVTFSNYQSLAGAFVYIFSPDDGIHKINIANPGSYADVTDEAINFKGYGLIDKGRTILWGVKKDPTGLYGSHIDGQDSNVYTTVSNENLGASGSTNYTGTLAFKAGGSTRTCFGLEITDGTETFTDNFDGTLTGDMGGTGTINYMTGAYDITFAATTGGNVEADYQWENSNSNGVTDFTKSATRLAGEGFVLRQDQGGDRIQVVIPLDGSYFSMKATSCYQLTLDAEDTAPDNQLIRTDIGVASLRSAAGTSRGIIFMNTANPTEPELHILKRNPTGDNFDNAPLFPHFKFRDFLYDDALVYPWDDYVLISCKYDSNENNRLLFCNIPNKTVDTTYYGIRAATKAGGYLYGGDPVSQTTYELLTGFDDNSIQITNYWDSSGETYETDRLKKVKRLRVKGLIDANQVLEVYIQLDNGDYVLVGTIRGDGDYVDYTSSYAIGTTEIGTATVGGDDEVTVYGFHAELKLRLTKFKQRNIRFVATGFGYVSVFEIMDRDIWLYENKLPKKYRSKQNVSLDGATTNMDTPDS